MTIECLLDHNLFMNRLIIVFLCLFVLVCLGTAQEAAPASPPTAPTAATQTDRAPIEAVLKSYVGANERRNMDDLLALWPELKNQQKEYKKIKGQFEDKQILSIKVTLNPQEIQATKDDAVARCQRMEEVVKLVTHSQSSGDSMMSNPAQRPPPTQEASKETEKKKQTLWFKLHKDGDSWKIVAVRDKQIPL